ncbi:MAG: lipoyl(octanoyl) transferase LipB [Candidatus Omnitrophota bacterium]
MEKLAFIDLGITDFDKVWDLQKNLVFCKKKYGGSDVLIFCEHKPVITLGRMAKESNILINVGEMKEKEISLFKIDRGGDVTLHSPGQLVAYPIFDLKKRNRDIRVFMRGLEKVVIDTLLVYNIKARVKDTERGVWVGEKKICSLGIGVSGWVTYHGIALNVNNNLSFFSYIKPCGLDAVTMTSIRELADAEIDIKEVKKILAEKVREKFG